MEPIEQFLKKINLKPVSHPPISLWTFYRRCVAPAPLGSREQSHPTSNIWEDLTGPKTKQNILVLEMFIYDDVALLHKDTVPVLEKLTKKL